MCYIGLAGARPPRPPDGRAARRPRRFGRLSMRPVAGSARLAASARSASDATGRLSSPGAAEAGATTASGESSRFAPPPLRFGPLGDSPATVADGGWLLTDTGVRLVNETGIDGSTAPPRPSLRPESPVRRHGSPSRQGKHQPGATQPGRCDGGTPVGPENRGFSMGRSRQHGRRNTVWLFLPASTGRSSKAGVLRGDAPCGQV